MDKAFEQLQKQGKNTIENLIKWMQDAQILTEKKTEEHIKHLLEDADDKKTVELKKFKEVLNQIAIHQKIDLEEMGKKLTEGSVKFLEALAAGAQAGVKAIQEQESIEDLSELET